MVYYHYYYYYYYYFSMVLKVVVHVCSNVVAVFKFCVLVRLFVCVFGNIEQDVPLAKQGGSFVVVVVFRCI